MTGIRLRLLLLSFLFAVCFAGAGWWWNSKPHVVAERLLRQGKNQEALTIVETELKRLPESPSLLSVKGRALAAMDKWREAISTFEQYPVTTSEDLRIWSQCLLRGKHWQDAHAIIQKRMSEIENDGETLRDLIVCQMGLDQVPAARETAIRLRGIPDSEVLGLYFVGLIDRKVGDNFSAVENWKLLLAKNPNAEGLPLSPAEFLREFGSVCLDDGRAQAAVLALEKSQSFETSNAELLLTLADARWLMRDAAAAEASWKAVLAEQSQNSRARIGLAEIALERDESEKAIEWLLPVSELPDTSADVAFLLQRAYTRTGQLDDAERWHQRAAILGRLERLESVITQMAGSSTRTYWASIVMCYRLANVQRWREAAESARIIMQYQSSPFLEQLEMSILNRTGLPDLENIFGVRAK